MLVTTDLVRDVYANELIELAKCVDRITKSHADVPSDIMHDMKQHIANMSNMVIQDFKHIPVDMRIWEIEQMAETIVRERGKANECTGSTRETGDQVPLR